MFGYATVENAIELTTLSMYRVSLHASPRRLLAQSLQPLVEVQGLEYSKMAGFKGKLMNIYRLYRLPWLETPQISRFPVKVPFKQFWH